MKAKIVWVGMHELNDDGEFEPVLESHRSIRFEEPEYDRHLYEKFVLIPVEEEE